MAEKKKLTKAEKKELRKKQRGNLWKDFKAFINRGNVVDMAVGVIMGSAFGAIVTAFTNILLSICTWGVPGGLTGLVTVLPAANDAQKGIEGIGQYFSNDKLAEMAKIYCEKLGGTYGGNEAQWINSLKTLYTQHGDTWTYKQSAIIDWGTFINAIIAFLIIALTLFVILKTFNYLTAKRKALEEAAKTAALNYKKTGDKTETKEAKETEAAKAEVEAQSKVEDKKAE
ncbi:MAG: MscL family protein [Clostridium sp.]|nr:MscL family protein [Clostridium sp.]